MGRDKKFKRIKVVHILVRAWKEYCAGYWLKQLRESKDRWTGRCNITEILLKRRYARLTLARLLATILSWQVVPFRLLPCSGMLSLWYKLSPRWQSLEWRAVWLIISVYLSSLPVAHLSDAPRRRLVVTRDSAKIQDETTENSAWFFNVLGV